jgi:hypothetical protein
MEKNIKKLGKITTALAVLIIAISNVTATPTPTETPQIEWIRQFGTPSDEVVYGISADSTGIYIAGYTQGTLPGQTSSGGVDAFMRKYSADGTEIWTRQFGTSSTDVASGIYADSTGIYIAGGTAGDAFVSKYSADGTEIWTRQFGTPSDDYASGIYADSTGIYIIGHTRGTLPGQTSSGSYDAFVRKYSADGAEIWTRQFGTSSFEDAEGIYADSTGIYVVGQTIGTLPGQTSSGSSYYAFVRKYGTDGTEIWTRQFGTSSNGYVIRISADSTGIYIAGQAGETLLGQTSSGGYDAFVRKYSTDGTEIWTRQFGTPSDEMVYGISADSTGIYIAGYTQGTLPGQTSSGSYDAFVRKYSTDGTEIWTRQFGTSSTDVASGIYADSTGIYIAGYTQGTLPGQTSSGGYDAFVEKMVKIDETPLDKTAPTVECGSADGLWHGSDVSIACTASDSGSGLANPSDASFSLSTNVAIGEEASSASTDSRTVCDQAGNCVTAGPISGNMVDKKAPSISILTPITAGTYTLNQAIASSYSCSDGGSGIATCDGPVANGANFDTSRVSSNSFTVSATDKAANTASVTNIYTVQYSQTSGRSVLPPLQQVSDPAGLTKAYKIGSTLPIKFQLADNNGAYIGGAQATLAVSKISSSTDAGDTIIVLSAGSSDTRNIFRYDSTAQQYIYNLKTTGYTQGYYRIVISLDDNSQIISYFEMK